MSAHRPRPVNEERPFTIDELFFSTTDAKGLIRHGNQVFNRVSGYDEAELTGTAHNIVRHPDMPRAVFQLLWDYIQSGRTIAAYVKNLAKDGRYYWVLAVAMPCPGGYLSVRLKPSSPIFEKAKLIYQEAVAVEKRVEADASQRKEAIAAGLDFIVMQLASAGFASYDEFMQTALAMELSSRRDELQRRGAGHGRRHRGVPAGDRFGLTLADRCRRIQGQLETMFSSLEQLKLLQREFIESAKDLEQTSNWIQNASLNATITSQTLGSSGRVLAEIARLLRDSSCDTIAAIGQLSQNMDGISRRLGSLAFDVAVTELQVEVCTFFADELHGAGQWGAGDDSLRGARTEESLGILLDQLDARTSAAYGSTAEMCRQLGEIRVPITNLSRLLGEMRMIQFSGRKESLAHAQGREFAIVFEDVARRVKESTKVCAMLMESIGRCELMLADAAQGERTVAKDLNEARLAGAELSAG